MIRPVGSWMDVGGPCAHLPGVAGWGEAGPPGRAPRPPPGPRPSSAGRRSSWLYSWLYSGLYSWLYSWLQIGP